MSATNQSSVLKLAVSVDSLSPRLSALLALQRAEEPETVVLLREATYADVVRGVEDGTYDAGLAMAVTLSDHALNKRPLWADELVLAVPLRSPLLAYAEVPLAALLHYPLLQWRLRTCEALGQQVDALLASEERPARDIASFELMTVLVAAGYGVGIAPRSNIIRARGWGVAMRPLANGPYIIQTQLLQLSQGWTPTVERLAERAATIAAAEPT